MIFIIMALFVPVYLAITRSVEKLTKDLKNDYIITISESQVKKSNKL